MYVDCTFLLTSVDLNSQGHALCGLTVFCCFQVLTCIHKGILHVFDCTLLFTGVDLNSQGHASCILTIHSCLQVLI